MRRLPLIEMVVALDEMSHDAGEFGVTVIAFALVTVVLIVPPLL
jgi:hypothetical protein